METDTTRNCGMTGIQGYTVEDILESKKWEILDLLKIDIEGAEKELFKYALASNWMRRVRIMIVELHDWLKPGCSLEFFKAMANMNNIEMSLSGENIIIENKELTSGL